MSNNEVSVNNKDTRTMSGASIINFEHILHLKMLTGPEKQVSGNIVNSANMFFYRDFPSPSLNVHF